MAAAAPHHSYYRVEISGGHTGSAFRYHSGIFGTLAEVQRELRREFSDPQGAGFIVFEAPTLVLEHYEDGERRGAWSAFPAVKLRLDTGHTLAFEPSGKLVGIDLEPGDDGSEHPVLGPLLNGEVEIEPHVDLAALSLPAPNGEALREGKAIAFERNGERDKQAYGWVGAWGDTGREPYERDAAP